MKDSELIAQGGYGCVYYPPIKCKKYNTKNYISKIQVDSPQAKNELVLGEYISDILDSRFYFAPTIGKCNLNISKAKLKDKESCRVFKTHKQEKFVNLIMPYIDGGSIDEFISKNNNPKLTLLTIIHSYSHLLKSIKILQEHAICHFDIKTENVLFDETINLPIIIDFGLSIYMPDIKNIKKYFLYFTPSYHLWPVEIHYLCYLLYEKAYPTIKDVENITHTYTSIAFKGRFSHNFIAKYNTKCIEFLTKFIGREPQEVASTIITYWNTWDIFSLSFMYFDILIPIADNNPFTIRFSELLLQNIHPDPTKRNSIEKTSIIFNKFKNNQKYDQIVKRIEGVYLHSLQA